MHHFRLVPFVLAAVLAAGSVACGSSGTSNTPAAVEMQTPSVSTGVPEIDGVVNTALSANGVEMAKATGYQKVPCETVPANPSIACRGDEPARTPIEVLAVLGCDNYSIRWIRPEDVSDTYVYALGPNPVKLAGIYAPTRGAARFNAQYVAVLRNGEGDDGKSVGVGVYLDRGRIVAIEPSCGDLDRLLQPSRVARWVVAPAST